jgi:hypothetical protein
MNDLDANKLKIFSQEHTRYIDRERCLRFREVLRENGYTNQIPLEEAKRLFQARALEK